MLVQNPIPRVPPQHVLLVVGRRRQLLEPLLGDVDLALGRAGVDLLQPVRRRIDHTAVGERFEESLARETDDLAFVSVGIDCEELDDSVGDFFGR